MLELKWIFMIVIIIIALALGLGLGLGLGLKQSDTSTPSATPSATPSNNIVLIGSVNPPKIGALKNNAMRLRSLNMSSEYPQIKFPSNSYLSSHPDFLVSFTPSMLNQISTIINIPSECFMTSYSSNIMNQCLSNYGTVAMTMPNQNQEVIAISIQSTKQDVITDDQILNIAKTITTDTNNVLMIVGMKMLDPNSGGVQFGAAIYIVNVNNYYSLQSSDLAVTDPIDPSTGQMFFSIYGGYESTISKLNNIFSNLA